MTKKKPNKKRQMPQNNPEKLDVYYQTDNTVSFTNNKAVITAQSDIVFNLNEVR